MRTPSLRSRVRYFGAGVVLVLLLAADVVVYLSVRTSMEAGLTEVLEARADIAEGLVSVVPDAQALADELTERGIPAVVTGPDGSEFSAEPAVPRFSQGGVPTVTPFPRVSLQRSLDEGMSVVIFATRAGVQETLRRLALTLGLVTAAGFVASLLLLDRAARSALAPLDDVITTAESTGAGQVTDRLLPDRTQTELGRLAVAFDEMLDRLQSALEDADVEQERTRRFLADAAHQLRTPIAGIQASVEMLLREDDPVERDRLMGSVVRETGRSARLLHALLRMAYLDQGRHAEGDVTDLAPLVRSEVERASDLAPRLRVDLTVHGDLPTLRADAAQLKEAVGNLLDNARRHARTIVDVHVLASDGAVRIVIADDGPGIPDDEVDLAFERFATLDDKGGSGLGLPIARGIAQAHGGDVTYAEGAFVLSLPYEAATSASTERMPATSPSDTT